MLPEKGESFSISPTANYFPSIDSLRFLAFMFVFLGHINLPILLNVFQKTAWFGVELFFLISGFLLTRLLQLEHTTTQKINIRKYFTRRILRIWPLYYSYLFLTVIISLLKENAFPNLIRFSGNVFFADNIFSAFKGYNTNLGVNHLWSISLEEQYYLILPFFMLWLFKQPIKKIRKTLIILFALLITGKIVAITFQMQHPFIYVLPFSAECFLLGCVLGLGIYNHVLKKIDPLLLFATGVALLFVVFYLPPRQVISINQLFIYPLTAASFGFILYSVTFNENKFLQLFFENPIIVYLGKISFGLYIFHRIVIDEITILFLKASPLLQALSIMLMFIITVAVSILSYEMFEKRFLKLKESFAVVNNKKV
jgi:peptidoglycan/LPS O-acetylase OafA/YrhL